MGVRSDIIIADRSEAAAAAHAGGTQDQHWPTLEWKGIVNLELGRLYGAINRGELPLTIGADCLLETASEEGPWVYLIPDEMTRSFAAVEPDAGAHLSTAIGWPSEQVADICNFARRATDAGRDLLLILSL